MQYRVVENYYRQEHFDFYRGRLSPFYGATIHLPVSRLKAYAKENGYPVYLSLCYFFTKAMQGIEDFRYRLLDDRIVLYDEVHPGLTLPAPGGLFRFAYFDYRPEPADFFRGAQAVLAREPGEELLVESRHRNYIFFTVLPKVPFTSFTHAYEAGETEPKVAFGRIEEVRGRLRVPVGIQVNHVFVDGNALGELVERAEAVFEHPG